MRQTAMRFVLALWAVVTVVGIAGSASANKLDLALTQFIQCDANGYCQTDNASYESFIMEYAYGVSPRILAPAETLGYSGFYMGLEGTLTPRFGSAALWETGTAADGYVDVMFMPAVHIRKGLPWSFEIGGTLNYLAQSEVVGLGGEIKWSAFEGYKHGFRGALPDLSARGQVMRIMGQTDIDMTIIGVDGSISYPFGIGGMISLTPYVGYQHIFTIINVEPLIYYDGSTYQEQQGVMWNTNELGQPTLDRSKLFFGFRFSYERLSITIEIDWGLAKTWDLDEANHEVDANGEYTATDSAGTTTDVPDQIRISGGVGLDF